MNWEARYLPEVLDGAVLLRATPKTPLLSLPLSKSAVLLFGSLFMTILSRMAEPLPLPLMGRNLLSRLR